MADFCNEAALGHGGRTGLWEVDRATRDDATAQAEAYRFAVWQQFQGQDRKRAVNRARKHTWEVEQAQSGIRSAVIPAYSSIRPE